MPYLSSYLWFPAASVSAAKIAEYKVRFTVRGKLNPHSGEYAEAQCWAETPKAFGIPRIFAEKMANVEDRTTYPKKLWPRPALGYRPGQRAAVDGLVRWFRSGKYSGRLSAAVGTGKTSLALRVAAKLKTRILVIVMKDDLADSFIDDLKKFFPGATHGRVQGDTWDWRNKHMVVATGQTLWSRRESLPKGFTKHFGMVVLDEGHHTSCRTLITALGEFDARYRLGVSATWRRADQLDAVFDLMLGPVVHTATSQNVAAEYTLPKYVGDFGRLWSGANVAQAVTKLSKNEKYNEWLVDTAVSAAKRDRAVVLLSDRTEQLEKLTERIQERFDFLGLSKTAKLFIGKVKKEDRGEAMQADVIMATWAIMAEGTNIPRLDTLILATPRGDVEQACGRIQRIHEGKQKPLIVDPVLVKCNYPGVHGTQRKRLRQYAKLGFTERKVKR